MFDDRCRLSPNATIMSFPAFSGGKFLSNCLSLSRHCCPQDPATASYLLEYPDDYEYRMDRILTTLPSKKRMKDWRFFEFGNESLYGAAVHSWQSGSIGMFNDITRALAGSGMKFFITEHSVEPLGLASVWTNATILRFINFRRFQKIAWQLKHSSWKGHASLADINANYCKEKYDLLRGPDWPEWKDFERSGYDIRFFPDLDDRIKGEMSIYYRVHLLKNPVILYDVDSCYFDRDRFLESLEVLYGKLGFTDYQPDLVDVFYKKYMQLHS